MLGLSVFAHESEDLEKEYDEDDDGEKSEEGLTQE